MSKLRYWLSSFFGIPKSQANGLIILLPLCFIIIAVPYLYNYVSFREQDTNINTLVLDSLIQVMDRRVVYIKEEEKKTRNFPSYSKNQKESTYKQYKKKSNNKYYKKSFPTEKEPRKEFYAPSPFDINTADTIQLKQLRGIGSVLSNRIVKYRDLLGGFVDQSQYKEVYGLKDSVIIALDSIAWIDESFEPLTLNINSVDEWTLTKHPYLNKRQARAILNYGKQHGKYKSAEDLFNIKLLDSATIVKVSPYLDY